MTHSAESQLRVTQRQVGDESMLSVHGTLDTRTYRRLRDEIIKAALDEPNAVIIDVSGLRVPASSAWAVFTSARWHVSTWPDIQIVLVCDDSAMRWAIAHSGITRYVPVFPTIDAATGAVSHAESPRYRHRARVELPATVASLPRSRAMVEQCLTAWSRSDLIPVSKVVVTALVENVLRHTRSRPDVRLEAHGDKVTVAVADDSPTPASFRELQVSGERPTGLRIVASLTRAWGNAPTPAGKTIWTILGPENRL